MPKPAKTRLRVVAVLGSMTSAVVATAVLALTTLLSVSSSPAAAAASFTSAFFPSQNCKVILPLSVSMSSLSLGYCNPSSGSISTTSPFSFGSQRMKKHAPRTICHYTDEWLDAEIELAAFNIPRRHRHNNTQSRRQRRRHRHSDQYLLKNKNNYPHSLSSSSSKTYPKVLHSLRQLVFLPIIKFYLNLKEIIRTKLERSTVYVLECENNKYYVGSTTNRKRRYHQHMHRKGSKWTKVHRPTSILKEYKRIPSMYLLGMESKVTAETMLRYGVNNVRGSMFCSVRNYHLGDIDALTKFIGHYNDLEYGSVYSKLCRMLPPPPPLSSSQIAMQGVEGGGGRRRGKPWRKNTGNANIAASSEEEEKEDGQLENNISGVAT